MIIYIYSGLSSHHITCKPPMISTMFGWHPLCQGWTALCHHPHELEPQIHPTSTGKTSASAGLCWWYTYMFVCVYMCLYVFICDHDSQSYIASSGFVQGFVVRISYCLGSRGMGRLPSGVAWWRDWAARMPRWIHPRFLGLVSGHLVAPRFCSKVNPNQDMFFNRYCGWLRNPAGW